MQCAVHAFTVHLTAMVIQHEPHKGGERRDNFYTAMAQFLDEAQWSDNPPAESIEQAREAIAEALKVELDHPKVTGIDPQPPKKRRKCT